MGMGVCCWLVKAILARAAVAQDAPDREQLAGRTAAASSWLAFPPAGLRVPPRARGRAPPALPAPPMGVGGSSQDFGPEVDLQFVEEVLRVQSGEASSAALSGRRLGPPEVRKLCEALACTQTLKALELDSNKIGDEGAASLAETLAGGSDVSFLDLTDNGIGDAGAIALGSRLGGNCSLRHLDLTSNKIQGDGGLALGRMLTVNSGLRQLALCENPVGAAGARAIGLALSENSSLRILSLRACGLGPEGAELIAQGLRSNTALVELSVGLNGIGDGGAAAFAEVIRMNRSVKEIYLDDNGVEGFGADLIAKALVVNDCLQTLWLVRNRLHLDVVEKFARIFPQHPSLKRLGITCTDRLPGGFANSMKQMQHGRKQDSEQRAEKAAPVPQMPEECEEFHACDNDEPRAARRSHVAERRINGSVHDLHDNPLLDCDNDEPRARSIRSEESVQELAATGHPGCAAREKRSVSREAAPFPSPSKAHQAAQERMVQQLIMWDNTIEIEDLPEVHQLEAIPPIDVSED